MERRDLSRTLPIGGAFVRGTSALIVRTLRVGDADASRMIRQLFPKRMPTFGDVWAVTADDLARLSSDAGLAVSPVDARDLVSLFQRIDPWTLFCQNVVDECEQFVLSADADTTSIRAGTLCPYCRVGTFGIEPMLLRRINWATGTLVDPEMREDIRTVPGKAIPLLDDGIRAWAGTIDRNLDRALADAKLPIYALLAYFNLSLQTPTAFGPRQAERLLAGPAAFGLDDAETLRRHVDGAKRFRDAREVTNGPKEFLTDGKRRDAFVPFTLNGRPYLVEGLLGNGDKCDVFRARTDSETPELVIVKALACEEDADLFRSEIAVARRFQTFDDVSSEFFRQFVPDVADAGTVAFPDGTSAPAVAYRNAHQFDWTVADILREYPKGIHPKDVVWMTNRVCDLLAWIHGKRIVHGAIVPDHLVIKCETHSVRIVDWGYASGIGQPLRAMSVANGVYYPDALRPETRVDVTHDLAMACRVGIALLGGNPATGQTPRRVPTIDEGPVAIPDPIADLLFRHAMYATSRPAVTTVAAFKAKLKVAAEAAYGPPRYHPFSMPRPRP